MVSAKHACPDCGCLDLEIAGKGIYDKDGGSLAKATCPICAWSGSLKDTVGIATSEALYDIETLAVSALRVVSKHAAGPLIQLFTWYGLIPPMLPKNTKLVPKDKVKEYNEVIQRIRDHVMRATFEAAITSAFNSASDMHQKYKKVIQDFVGDRAYEVIAKADGHEAVDNVVSLADARKSQAD